jgi:hypothetical protein
VNITSIFSLYRDFDEKSYYFSQREELKRITIFRLPSTLYAGITCGVIAVIKLIKDKRTSIQKIQRSNFILPENRLTPKAHLGQMELAINKRELSLVEEIPFEKEKEKKIIINSSKS